MFYQLETLNTVECEICTENHHAEKCPIFENRTYIEDTKIPPKAMLTLPLNLKVDTLSDGTKTVVATQSFPKGTQFGPLLAMQLYSLNPFTNFPLKIFGSTENMLPDYYLDTTNEDLCNWMCYVALARSVEEQNLICYQLKNEIFFSAIRDINPGEQLKVWYSPYYATKMGAKILMPANVEALSAKRLLNDVEEIQKIAETLPASKLGAETKENWCCKMCGQIEENVVTFAKHLQKHYIKMISNLFACDICNEGFSSKKHLMKHKRTTHIVFTDNKPMEIEEGSGEKTAENKTSELMESCISLPLPIDSLMNETLTESDPDQLNNPSLLMLDQLTNNSLYNDLNDVDTLRAILCDDNTKASKTAQEKSIADFSLEFVEGTDTLLKLPMVQQPPYICDICNKNFQTLQYLCRHLKKHTGDFTCLQCLQVFSRKENYLYHSCFVFDKNPTQFNCTLCPKAFQQKKYLQRHMARHLQKHECANCGNRYTTVTELTEHNCSSIANTEKPIYECTECKKRFYKEQYLKRHLRTRHKKDLQKANAGETNKFICDVCAEQFTLARALKQHMLQHAEPKYECAICCKKFYRFDIYTNHLLSHGKADIPCEVCGKKLKTKKNLLVHMLQHSEDRPYSCQKCDKVFTQRTNLLRHQSTHLHRNPVRCCDCAQTFETKPDLLRHHKTEHSKQTEFKCTTCDKNFAKNHQLTHHLAQCHLNKVYACRYCQHTFKHRSSVRRHLLRIHLDKKPEWDNAHAISSLLVDQHKALKETEKQTVEKQINVEDREVLLSMPETDQQITLGKNAFILDDGTIVQPQDEGNIMFFVLDEQLVTKGIC